MGQVTVQFVHGVIQPGTLRHRSHQGHDGHQAIQPIAFSRTKYNAEKKRVDLVDIVNFEAECVNPPPGVKAIDWIKGGMKNDKCK
mgnify:CR=1 FL=1